LEAIFAGIAGANRKEDAVRFVVETVHFGRWQLEADPVATREAYASILKSGPEECSCEPCKNFIAARERTYPAEVLALFERLGISFDREVEVYHMARMNSGKHLYGGWFHFVGSILSGADAFKQVTENVWRPDLEKVTEDFSLGFRSRVQLLRKPFEGKPIVQVEFTANVPWVISSPEPK
jgi:hypothetical protein